VVTERGPAAAVVIPTRNRRHTLERAIRSVSAQSLRDWELVVVDDASTDETAEFLQSIDDPQIRIERLVQHGERTAARNRGLELVRATAVLFLDDDDELPRHSLAVLTDALDRHPSAYAAVGAVVHEVDGTRWRASFPKRAQLLDIRLELLAGWQALNGQCLLRTDLLREIGGYRAGLPVAEDQELWLRLCRRGPVAIVPDAVLIYHSHGLDRDAPGGRDVERGLVADHLRESATRDARARRAARAREHLRDADIAFRRGSYRVALAATIRGIAVAPFLLGSRLIGPGIARGLVSALAAATLPSGVTERLRAGRRRRRDRAGTREVEAGQ
jgi:glycosyltransferase involved in cell wall biosynthesis